MTTNLDQAVVNELDNRAKEREWPAKPKRAQLLRICLNLLPLASAVSSSVVFSHIIHQPRTALPTIAWLLSLLLSSTLILVLVERQTRRFLPLVALLKLTMVFPDQAPSRFKSAMRAGSVRQLEERVSDVELTGRSDKTSTEAAAWIIELVTSLTYHDRRTRGHAERVKAYALLIGQELGLSKDDCNKLMWAALLHDVGKVAVSAEILNKRGAPSTEEWEAIKKHPFEGKRLLEPLLEWMGPFANAAWEHHEKWNGQGYPLGLSGDAISISGRVVALADAFEVMTATRAYKKPMSILEAREEVVRCAGTHFDPAMVRAFLNISLGRLRFVTGPAAWIAQIPFLGWTAPVSVPVVVGTIGKTMALVSFVHGVTPSALGTQTSPANKAAAATTTAVFTAASNLTQLSSSTTPVTPLSSSTTSLPPYQQQENVRYQAPIPSQESLPQYNGSAPSTTPSSQSQSARSHQSSVSFTTIGSARTGPGNSGGTPSTSASGGSATTSPGNSGGTPSTSASGGSATTSPGNSGGTPSTSASGGSATTSPGNSGG
ncbi:MAG: HD domain-containing phosphohydrolase, partial [Acidimicrobiales bacterium]